MRSRVQRSSSDGRDEGADRRSPAPGKRPLTASIQRKASAAKDHGAVQLNSPVGAAAGSRADAAPDLMDFFMGPAPVQMKPKKDASPDAVPSNVLDGPTTLAFDTIYRLAEEALWALENADHEKPDHAKRDAIVDEYAAQIGKAATAAGQLVKQTPWSRREIFYVPADMAAEKVLAVSTWIMSRTGNARMRSRFEQAVHVFDDALQALMRPPVTARSTPALRGQESFEAHDETADLEHAQEEHAIALRDLRDAKINYGIEPFHDLAALEDNPEPSFMLEMMKSVLVATLGHIAGGVFGLATKGVKGSLRASTSIAEGTAAGYGPAVANVVVGKATIDPSNVALERAAIASVHEHFKNVTIDSVQGIGASAADAAFAEASKDNNAKTKARTFFVAGLKSAAGKEQSQHEQLISREKAAGIATAASLRAETTTLRAMEREIGALYLQRASAGWASYLAQQALGKTGSHDPSGRQASNMKSFLGEPVRDDAPNGDRAFGSDKSQLDGVLHLHLEIDADARHGAKPNIRRKGRVTIEGVNDALREQILLDAGGHIGKVWLPKVVYVSMANNSFHAARLALDERNVLRDHTEWEYIQRHTQHVADRAFESPEGFASLIRGTELA
jgi:hypothetical protein